MLILTLEDALNVVTDAPNVALRILVINAKINSSLRMANARLVELLVLLALQQNLVILA